MLVKFMNQIKCHQSIIDHEIVKNDSSLSHAIGKLGNRAKYLEPIPIACS